MTPSPSGAVRRFADPGPGREVRPGDVVDGRFDVLSEAGSGAMGSVLRARDRETGELVAIKVLHGSDPSWAERFAREASVLSGLTHPGVVRYVAHGATPGGARWIAMAWLEGEGLEARLSGRGVAVAEAVEIARRAADALGFAHAKGIVHRDVKPSNLFLVGDDPSRLQVLDFGIARIAGAARRITRTVALLGTPGYMAPEQARGERDVGPAADVFALGCVLFECLAGRPAFSGGHPLGVLARIVLEDAPPLASARPDLAGPLADLVARMTARDPAARPADGSAAAEALAALGTLGGAPPLRGGPPETLTETERRVVCVVLAAGREESADTAATMAPADVAHALAPVRAAIAKHGARAEMLVDGSAVVLVSGTGTPVELAVRAARAALAVRSAFVGTPVVLVTGRGVVSGRLPVGEVVDAALAAVEGAPSNGIRIDRTTAGLVGDRFDVREDPGGLVLAGERETASEARTFLGRPAPCVGRDREVSLLLDTWDDAIAERASRAVLVTGPAGVGKSRLRDEAVGRLRARGHPMLLLFGRGDEISAGSAFGLVAPALRRHAGLAEGDSQGAAQDRVRERFGRALGDADREGVVEFLGELVGVPFPDEGRVQLRAARRDRVLLGDRIRSAFEAWLAAECERQPVLLVLEDLHWGDLPTVALVDGALRALSGAPFVVLAVARDDVRDRFPDLWGQRDLFEIRLGRLARAACDRLVRSALGEDVAPERIARIVELADGNAFFLEEILRAVSEGKGDALPDTVLGMVQARLDGLDADARRVLRAASVFGRTFWSGGVAALAGEGRPATWATDRLDALAASEVVSRAASSARPGDTEWRFRHVLVREAAYATLTERDGALGHRLAAEWLERSGERDPLILAEHLERGGDRERAADFYLASAIKALEGNDLAGAVARADRGVACAGGREVESERVGALRLVQAEASRWSGALAEAAGHAAAAIERFLVGSARRYDAIGELIVASGRLGRVDDVERWAEALRTSVPRDADARIAHASALSLAAWQIATTHRADLGTALFEAAERAVASIGDEEPLLEAELLRARASALVGTGDLSESVRLYEAAALSFDRAGDVRSACVQRGNAAYSRMLLGQDALAERTMRDALAAAERMSLWYIAAFVQHNFALVLGRRGLFVEARAVGEKAASWFAARGDVTFHGASLMHLARVHLLAGEASRAVERAKAAVDALAGIPRVRSEAEAVLSRALLLAGDAPAALAAARAGASSLAAAGGSNEHDAIVALALAEALEATGDAGAAKDVAHAARERLGARAEKIRDAEARSSYLALEENAKLAAWSRGEVAAARRRT